MSSDEYVLGWCAEKLIPVKKKSRRACFSTYPRVTKAREEIKAAYDAYQNETNGSDRAKYKQTEKNLEYAYNLVMKEDLSRKIQEIEKAHDNCRHGESWRSINDITGRKIDVFKRTTSG